MGTGDTGSSAFVIVPLDEADLPAAAAVIAAGEIFQRYGVDQERAARSLRDSASHALVARVGDAVIGVAIFRIDGRLPIPAYLQTLAVQPGWRSRGVGKALLRAVEERVFATGPNLFLYCTEDNLGARRFYEREGYQVVGTVPDLLLPGRTEVLYRKTLGPIRTWPGSAPSLLPDSRRD